MTTPLDDADRQFLRDIRQFMYHDISAAIRGGANYLAALGLLEYSEILGGWRRRKMGEFGEGKNNFDEFFAGLKKVNPSYAAFERDLSARLSSLPPRRRSVYSVVRAGLAHRYLMQAKSTVVNNPDDAEGERVYDPPCGLYFKGDFLVMNTNQYFKDFKAVVAEWETPRTPT